METKSESTKRFREAADRFKEYFVSCINNKGYSNVRLITTECKLKFLHDTFIREAGWNIERVGEQNAFREWLMGLPSSINIEFENYKILQLAKRLGSLLENATDKQEDKLLENYWNYAAVKGFQLFNKFKIA